MIADQERNVKQWWDDRNNFISSQKTKNEGRRSLNEVLCVLQTLALFTYINSLTGKALEANSKPNL
jgi:hypothetical protein